MAVEHAPLVGPVAPGEHLLAPSRSREVEMARYGGFEVQATCSNCGQPLPINGLMRTCACTECFGVTRLPPDDLAGFLNDFEKEDDGLEEKQGRGGQMMSAGQSYRYGYFRLAPRCDQCKSPLPESPLEADGRVTCPGCGAQYHVHPAPAWVRELVPSAAQVISPEREPVEGQPLQVDQEKPQPVLMSCPGCGGGLTITTDTERTCTCRFCSGQVFIPDELWKRLHPVKVKRQWFVRFEGPTTRELDAERRQSDLAAQRTELAKRGPFVPLLGGVKRRMTPLSVACIVLGILICVTGVVLPILAHPLGLPDLWWMVTPSIIVGAVVISLGPMVPSLMGARTGALRDCKRALIDLGQRLSLDIQGEDEPGQVGRVEGKVQGRDVTIDPSRDEAIEVDMDEGWSFFVRTDPRYADAPEGLWRFTTGDPRVDGFLPIRYAKPQVARRLEQHPERAAPLRGYLDRWGSRITHFEIAGDIGVHILPGGTESEDTKYLLPRDLEPLLLDTLALAKALDAVARGEIPPLPPPHAT
jgi:hypothetical protein